MGADILINNMDRLADLDEDTLTAVLAIYRADINEERTQLGDGQSHSTQDYFSDNLTALECYLDEVETQNSLARDARLAQSIVDAKLGDLSTIAEIAKEEAQAREDRAFAERLAGPNSVPRGAASANNPFGAPPTYEDAIEITSSPSLSKLAGLWVGTRAGRTLHPQNEHSDPNIEPEFDAVLQTECDSCGDLKSYFQVAALACNHQYCRECIHELFQKSFLDDSLFPPRCCRQHISISDVDIFMTKDLKDRFAAKTIEFNTPNKTYCANKDWGAFLMPQNIINNVGQCQNCQTATCTFCKNEGHADECAQDPNLQATLDLAQQEGWRRCGRCQAMVELRTGCFHITCRCSNDFCYLCGAPWKSCSCEQWDEARLTDRTAQVAAREGRRGDEAQVRHELITRHDCEHDRYRGVAGGRCDECNDVLPVFLYRCTRCGLELCRRCRHNRMR